MNGFLFEPTPVTFPITFSLVGSLDGPLPNTCAVEKYDMQYEIHHLLSLKVMYARLIEVLNYWDRPMKARKQP